MDAAAVAVDGRGLRGPTVRPGQVVVRDHRTVQHGATVRRLMEGAGCRLLFVPPNLPDVAPIGLAFPKRTAHVRGVAARTPERLEAAIGTALARTTDAAARGWLSHCGDLIPAQPP